MSKQFQSVRWMGYIQPSESGEYEFSTSDDSHATIQIDGKIIVQDAPMKEKDDPRERENICHYGRISHR
ncbi:PA14 domain-containing protein [Bacillus cereus]